MATGSRPPRIGIVAGEASGDLLGAHLIQAVRERLPDAEFYGIAGPKMQAAGARALWPMEKLAVRGYVEVLRHYREIAGIRRALRGELLGTPPDLFIGIDAPDFNLDLEEPLKAAGIPVLHYVSPSIWAWRGERIHQIKRAVSHMLALFPFEQSIYDEAEVPCTYVGHPLADILPLTPDRAAARELLGLDPAAPVVALLPGSRQSEIKAMAAPFLDAAQMILKDRPGAQFLVPLISRESRFLFETAMAARPPIPSLKLMFGHAHSAMTAANAVLVASGTATLEAALLKRPMVIGYRVPKLTAWLMRRKAYLPYAGLPNILAGRFIVPELLQEQCQPRALADAILGFLDNPQLEAEVEAEFLRMHEALRRNTSQVAADVVIQMLDR